MKVTSIALVAAVLGTSSTLASQSYTFAKSGRRSSVKTRQDMITNLEQCQQVCQSYFASPSSAQAAASASTQASESSTDSQAEVPPCPFSDVQSSSTASSGLAPMYTANAGAAASSSSAAEVVASSPSSSVEAAVHAVVTSAGSQATSSAVPTAAAAASTAPAATGDEATFLNMHNSVRAKYGASDVVWNATLAEYAINYANKCVKGHSAGPYGENLASSVGYPDPISVGVDGWSGEASSYSWGSAGFSAGTGHFTQMVWKSTTSIGCAHVECPSGSLFGGGMGGVNDQVVCEYYPAGNMEGAYQENVGVLVG